MSFSLSSDFKIGDRRRGLAIWIGVGMVRLEFSHYRQQVHVCSLPNHMAGILYGLPTSFTDVALKFVGSLTGVGFSSPCDDGPMS